MKKPYKYIFLLLAFIKFGCTEPAPTEIIVQDIPSDTQVDIEVLSPEPDLYVYQNGYDSIGYVAPTPTKRAIINLSGIRNTYKEYTVKRTSAFALFTDKNVKIETPNGRTIGYYSRLIGKVSFNDIGAIPLPRKVQYRWHGEIVDTLLGWVHYFAQKHGTSSLFPFPYNSNISFKLEPIVGNDVTFNIPTPEEIVGHVKVSGTRRDRNLEIALKWNPTNVGKVELVIGGLNRNEISPFPLYKIRVPDNGAISIPKSLIKTFPFDRFNQMVISFVRQKFTVDPNVNENIVVAQTVHNIKIDVP